MRYPLIEGFTGLLFLATFWWVGLSWMMLGYWLLLSWLVALSFIDLDTLTLPNALTQSGLLLGLVFQAGMGYIQGGTATATIHSLMAGVIGAVLGIWLFDGITLLASTALGQTAMGGGDAKLAAMLGAWLGWQGLLLSSFLACVVGAIVGGGAMALHLISRRQPLPFGPFLAIGAVLTIFWGAHCGLGDFLPLVISGPRPTKIARTQILQRVAPPMAQILSSTQCRIFCHIRTERHSFSLFILQQSHARG
jgi:leader peptidase (prepilin peptidase)/N-methyltransferase